MVIPIVGRIAPITSEVVQAGLRAADSLHLANVVLLIDTGGGRTDVVDAVVAQLDAYKAANPDAKVCAYVHGATTGGAWSAGAVLAMCTDRIFMLRGRAIGAAKLIFVSRDGRVTDPTDTPMGIKMDSAARAKFRARAQQHGYPAAIAEAMANDQVELWLCNDGAATELLVAAQGDARPEGRLLKPAGTVLSLTAEDAEALGIATVVETPSDVGAALGLSEPDLLRNEGYLKLLGMLQQEHARVVRCWRALQANVAAASVPQSIYPGEVPQAAVNRFTQSSAAATGAVQLCGTLRAACERLPVEGISTQNIDRAEVYGREVLHCLALSTPVVEDYRVRYQGLQTLARQQHAEAKRYYDRIPRTTGLMFSEQAALINQSRRMGDLWTDRAKMTEALLRTLRPGALPAWPQWTGFVE